MIFVVFGVVLILMNLAGIGPIGQWTWELSGDLWKFAVPFLLASIWWAYADASGLNKRREIEKMEKRKQDRRKQNLAALGLDTRARRRQAR
jgi:small Trp-rich protein